MDAIPDGEPPKDTFRPPSPIHVNSNRLSLPFGSRVTVCSLGGFSAGVFLGAIHGAQTAGFRFRAENSHRLPKSSKGWYFYHKSKNYHMMLHAVKSGVKLGTKMSLLIAGFYVVEEAVDELREQRDFLSTTIAGLSVSGVYSRPWSTCLSFNIFAEPVNLLTFL